jgi:hypothetical protein
MSVTMKSMGKTNADWGVCGFTSSFYAMWKLEKTARGRLINAPEPFNVLAEIKTYLRMLQAEGNQTALQAIEEFCRSFGGPFATFTVDDYCDRISAAVQRSNDEIKGDPLFGIGIPPDYVADYLRRMWGYTSTVTQVPAASDPGGDAIIGMTVKKGTRLLDSHGVPSGAPIETLYNRLVHYMYRRKGLIYSWGKDPFLSIEAAAPTAGVPSWQIGWVITIGPKS